MDAVSICSDLGAQEYKVCQKSRSYQRVVEKVEELIRKDLQSSETIAGFYNERIPGSIAGKESACNGGTWVQSLGWEDPLNTWQPTPVFLPGESPQIVESGGL